MIGCPQEMYGVRESKWQAFFYAVFRVASSCHFKMGFHTWGRNENFVLSIMVPRLRTQKTDDV